MFSKQDFQGDNLNRLCCIIMHEMGQHPLQKYNNLSYASQKDFDNRLNKYIQQLPDENWEAELINDFIEIMNNKIFVKEFNANEWQCDEVITDVQHLEKPTLQRDASLNIISVEHIDEPTVCKDI